jgi:hypothetical protein
MHREQPEGHCSRPERQSRGDHNQARGLVEDYGFQRREAEQPDEQRQAELSPTEPEQAAESTNDSATPKACGRLRGAWVASCVMLQSYAKTALKAAASCAWKIVRELRVRLYMKYEAAQFTG